MSDVKISVIMSVLNCEDTVRECMESLFAQTLTDWELIVCNDGSSDSTESILKSYHDLYKDRIVLLSNESNMGLNFSLNKCLKYAKGMYIARQDGDDISDTSRFQQQSKFLDDNPNIAIVSSAMKYFNGSTIFGVSKPIPYPTSVDFMRGTPFCHGPAMVRAEAYRNVGGYTNEKKLMRVEDYHLWVKMYSCGYLGYNLCEPLYLMRDDRNAEQRRKFRFRLNEFYVILYAVHALRLPFWYVGYALRPIIIGIIPKKIYRKLHYHKLNSVILESKKDG